MKADFSSNVCFFNIWGTVQEYTTQWNIILREKMSQNTRIIVLKNRYDGLPPKIMIKKNPPHTINPEFNEPWFGIY